MGEMALPLPLPIVGVYGFTWDAAQFLAGKASDRLGRQRQNVWRMWICGAGVGPFPCPAPTRTRRRINETRRSVRLIRWRWNIFHCL